MVSLRYAITHSIRSAAVLLAAGMLCSPAYAIMLNDDGVVGTIEAGTASGPPSVEIQWSQYLLDLANSVTQVHDADGDGADEAYQTRTSPPEYAGTLTDYFKDDTGGLTGWTSYEYVLGKYDGQNAGYILYHVADYLATFGTSLPGTSEPIWTNNSDEGYQLSHWTGFNAGNGTTVPAPATLLLLGMGLLGLGVTLRRKRA